ncbi:hypothetical protein LXL04_023472 [Taraxacum kok-saghyz]
MESSSTSSHVGSNSSHHERTGSNATSPQDSTLGKARGWKDIESNDYGDALNFKNTQEQYQEHSRTQLHLERVSLTYTMLYLEREFGCQEELKWDALNLCPRPPIYTTKGCIETKHEIMKLHCARVSQNPARARNETA